MEPKTHTLTYRDAYGFLQTLRVTTAERRAVLSARRGAARANARWRAHHVTFTDLGATIDAAEEIISRPSQQGNAWEGPRFGFSHLIGEGVVWQERGEDFCGGRSLRMDEYCLGCDRCGRDLVIPSPDDRRVRNHRDSGLLGGCEGKR